MLSPQNLTPEERRALEIAALTAIVTGIVGGLVSWGFEELKRLLEEHRESKREKEDSE